jgi:hypothetical protein
MSKAGEQLLEAAAEALAIAKGEQPAARVHMQGHSYVPDQRWQAMETAPKNGRHFLAVVEGKVRIVAFGKTSHIPLYGWNLADQGAEEWELCQPTHWMPLPEPPSPMTSL